MTNNEESVNEEILQQARQLLEQLESGDMQNARTSIDKLSGGSHDASLFTEVGKLTRQLHEAISSFQMDNRITDIAAQDIPDAKDRLQYVIDTTKNAADKTMDSVEQCIPLADGIKQNASELLSDWSRLHRRELKPGEFRELAGRVEEFLKSVDADAGQLHASLTDVLMAQGYQDLTGQVIQKVITMVHDVEENLITLIKMFGNMENFKQAQVEEQEHHGAEGPIVNLEKRNDVLASQDDVDDLLSSLGF
ncbi:protein phosphatase CheZ [Pleionea sp. CnH1-48]|uniref:protein phosphatase CheZ n=1 Tax=Pleionea sp. CnH1-48 TaxID=2954494 RepID=UPI00209796F3|nr:protein phosphatase CheZ [Pleionea sp. CnH1-48]MCO7226096.1 protein phosphatase CheZ [Pleionea sp. CnH1-48]